MPQSRGASPFHWQAVGQFGATARRIRFRLVPRLGEDLDVVVLLAGANDVMARRGPELWRDDLNGVLTALAHHTQQVVVAGIPPPEFFAADRFHPSVLGYRLWAQDVAARLVPVR